MDSQIARLKQSSLIALATAAYFSLEGEAAEHWTGLAKQEQQLRDVASEGAYLLVWLIQMLNNI